MYYRTVLQVEQVGEDGEVVCTYGPEPFIIYAYGYEDMIFDDFDMLVDVIEDATGMPYTRRGS